MTQTNVAAVIVTYNRADKLGKVIEQVLGQDRPADQIIVVDNASTDDTASVLDAYQDDATAASVAGTGRWRLEIVRRGDSPGFVPSPKRWIVERTFAWLGRCRRLAKDFENLAVNALAFLCLGMIRLMLRRPARASAEP